MNKLVETLKIILKIRSLCKTFTKGGQDIPVLNDISLNIPLGSKTVITGESGSGKTTFLSLIAGLDTIDSGEITIGNTKINTLNEKKRSRFRLRHIGFVFQYHYLLSDLSAQENVMIPLLMSGVEKKMAGERATNMLYKIGMKNRASHYPAQLSGGECQRIAIARALVHNPTVVLADEPTGALDSKNSQIIRDILGELVELQKTTLIIASHDYDFLSIANIRCNIKDGKMRGQIIKLM